MRNDTLAPMTSRHDDSFLELMYDFNGEMLIDLHEDLKEQYVYLGIMENSRSCDFIHCILDALILLKDDSFKPIINNDENYTTTTE